MMSADCCVSAFSAASAGSPFSTARCTLAVKSVHVDMPPDWNANFTPACARRPAFFGASTRSLSTRVGSGSASGDGTAVRRGKLSVSSTGTFSAFRRAATV